MYAVCAEGFTLWCFLIISFSLIQSGDVPLGKAAKEGHTEIVDILLKAGANVNHKNKVITITCVNLLATRCGIQVLTHTNKLLT